MKTRSLVARFLLLEVAYMCVMASFSSFAIAYLQSVRGVSDSAAGLLLTMTTVGAFAGQFFFGRLCDFFHTHKRMFFVVCGLIVPVAMALYFSTNLIAIYPLYALFGFVQNPLALVLDTWVIGSFPGNPGIYGKIRAGGALAYAATSFSFGRLLDTYGYGLIPYGITLFLLLAVVIAATIPDVRESNADRKSTQAQRGDAGRPSSLRTLFNPALMVFMFSLLATGTCGITYSFLPVMMENVGGSLGLLGLAMSSSGLAQIPFMFFSGKLRRIPARLRIAISGCIYFIMALLFAFGNAPIYLILGALISGGAYGILLPASRELVAELSPPDLRTTAQGMADAVYLSLSGVICSVTVGSASARFGMSVPILAIAGLQVTGIVVLLIVQARKRRLKALHSVA